MESTGSGTADRDTRPFLAQVPMQDEEKVPLQNSLPTSFGKANYTQSSSEQDAHGSEASTRQETDTNSPDRKYPWNSGIFTRFPFLGVFPLLLSVACKLFLPCCVSRCRRQTSVRSFRYRATANKTKVPALELLRLCTVTASW